MAKQICLDGAVLNDETIMTIIEWQRGNCDMLKSITKHLSAIQDELAIQSNDSDYVNQEQYNSLILSLILLKRELNTFIIKK